MLRAGSKAFNAERAEIAKNTRTTAFSDLSLWTRRLPAPLLAALLVACFIGLAPDPAVFAYGGSSAQVQDPAKILAAVKVKGTKRFKEEDVVAASGLRLGRPVSDEDFKKAARTLGDTGAFTDIAYSFSYSSAGTKLELQLTDAPKFLPAHFEDFVWFSDAELEKAIKYHVPLFNGDLPSFGHMPDDVSEALQTLLVQNAIPGRVEYLRTAGPSGDIENFNYSVSDVSIRVRNIEFTGVAPSELPLLEAAALKLPDREYSRSRLDRFVERDLLPILHARGFMKASFGPPQPKVVKASQSESGSETNDEARHRTIIDVELAVAQGLQYKVSRLEWSGNHAFPSEQLQAMIRLKPGLPANTVQLGDNLAEVRTLYGSHGYVGATIKVNAQFDDAQSTVAMQLEVKEGDVYHMGELEFRGLDNGLTAKLREAWKLRPGEVYDATYLEQYLPQAHKLLPVSLDWDVASHVTANVRDKTVDVDLQYSVKAPKQ
jgi:outer membrane protein assembly factor BamA